MITRFHSSLLTLLCGACLCVVNLNAGQFKRITIDGSFEDWAGVAPAAVDAEDATGLFDFKELYVANDDQYLYVRVKLHAPADYGSFNHHVLIDADANVGTGHGRLGIGSEFMIENGAGYQQKNGGFNEGTASDLDWQAAPAGLLTEFEARISRNVRDAEGQLVLTQDSFVLAFEAQNLAWVTKDIGPDSGGVAYDFAPTPPKATSSTTLLTLSNTRWRYHDAGSDLGTDWLLPEYDDTQPGWKSGSGLFGFGVTAGTYPANVQSAMTAGRSAYYLRVPFGWNYDSDGIALVMETYLSDGAVFYLNGTEVKRVRMPAGQITYGSAATGGPATLGRAENLTLPPAALVVGDNLLGVEVHQAAATPAELAFGLKLVATDSLPPAIEDPSQPADRTVVEGESTSFTVGNGLGTVPLSFQWFKDDLAIDGATSAVLTIPVVLDTDAGLYRVEITNATGAKAVSRAARLTTTAVPVSFTDPAEPVDRTVTEGEATTFRVVIAGSPTLYFQWSKDGTPIEGATGAEYTINSTALSDSGQYAVTVSNRVNAVVSRSARLQVVRDQAPAQIVRVTGAATRVIVQFSEPLDEASANTAAFYTLSGDRTVQAAVLDPADGRTVTLTTSALQFNTVYTLTVNGVKDRFGNAANTQAPFRASILIDGDFQDWADIPAAATETQDTAEGLEFKEIYVANDDAYLYVRFNFYAPVGPLPVATYYRIYCDGDGDPATGMATTGIGSEMMIENGGGYQQKDGTWNEGVVRDLDFAMAPQASSTDFECRLSRSTIYDNDGQPVFTGETVGLVVQLVSTGWATIDTAPLSGGVVYSWISLPPLNPGPLRIRMSAGAVELTWSGPGVLEARDNLTSGAWAPVTNATSPYPVSLTGQQRYFRLKL